MKKLVKALDVFLIIAALAAAYYVGGNIDMVHILKGKEALASKAEIEAGDLDEYLGKPAGIDVERITGLDGWDKTYAMDYVTVDSDRIIPTGISSLHPWVPKTSYSSKTRTRTRRIKRKPDITKEWMDIFDEYAEFSLIKLPDGSYIVAQIPEYEMRRLKSGKQVTLPVGKKVPLGDTEKRRIQKICQEYKASTDGVFYAIDQEWNKSHQNIMFFLRIGLGFVVLMVLGVLLLLLREKIIKVKE